MGVAATGWNVYVLIQVSESYQYFLRRVGLGMVDADLKGRK